MAGLKDIMEGKPLRAPVHPALVHLPIALLPLATVFDVASHAVNVTAFPFVRSAFICLVTGIATALLAAVFGFVDYTDIRNDHPAKRVATAHLVLNLVAVGLYAGSAGLRFGTLDAAATPWLPLILALVALAVLSYSGYLGGILVYDDGVAVGRHRRRTPTPEQTIIVRTNGKPVPVANAADLGEGESLRVDIDGTIAAVVKSNGEIHAFQEFCTHRFGPLSEGKLENGQVTCPWHGSCFDVRTGKVAHGPAKVDLLTFRTEVRDGKIWLHPPVKP